MGIESGPSSIEGTYSWERSEDLHFAVENMASPEDRAAIIEEIADLLAWLIEIGPGADPDLRKHRQASLRSVLARLGIDLDKPHWHFLYSDEVLRVAWEREHPRKPQNYPDFKKFSALVRRIVSDRQEILGDLRGRDGQELSQYLYGLGFIMSSRLSYRYIFPDSDPIVVNRETRDIEGRHRYLTLLVLEKLGFDIRQWYWVRVESR